MQLDMNMRELHHFLAEVAPALRTGGLDWDEVISELATDILRHPEDKAVQEANAYAIAQICFCVKFGLI